MGLERVEQLAELRIDRLFVHQLAEGGALAGPRAGSAFRHVGCMIPAKQRARGVEVADLEQAALELRELGLCRLSMAQAPAGFSPAFSRAHTDLVLADLGPGCCQFTALRD